METMEDNTHIELELKTEVERDWVFTISINNKWWVSYVINTPIFAHTSSLKWLWFRIRG